MKDVEYVIGQPEIENRGLKIFSDQACEFLADLSKQILSDRAAKAYSDLVSFAFWIRQANIQRLKKEYEADTDRLGRGICFHIAPSNIPVNFAYSYVFSLLAGNANIVRLPSKNFPQVDLLLKFIGSALKNHPAISERTSFVRYPRESEATKFFSKTADARMIWGGDSTIAQIRGFHPSPRATDIAFADRYSICLLDAEKVSELDEANLHRLAEDFYNDTYLMDQNACSSPQLIYWLNDRKEARTLFWAAVLKVAEKKYELQDAVAVDKFTKLCGDSIVLDNLEHAEMSGNMLYRIELDSLNTDLENVRGVGGYFYEYALKDLGELTAVISSKYQTITYFGVQAEQILHHVVEKGIRGIDRIVPVGRAMDIDVIWDGHDLIIELSRKVVCKA